MSTPIRPEYHKSEVVRNLWDAYKKTEDYKSGRIHSINSAHALIRKRESEALNRIIKSFLNKLQGRVLVKEQFQNRTIGEWIDEWKNMHATLFHDVLNTRGKWRTTEVRFGSPGDEEKHGVPKPEMVQNEMSVLAKQISEDLKSINSNDLNKVCSFLAATHYQYIRIHPFPDGNGRITRILTDQLAVCLGFPPIIAGYPRTNKEKKNVYHKAITACIYDPKCTELTRWIKGQIETKIEQIT